MEVIDKEMKVTPLLSISIPTWNRAKYLAISLESFMEQMKGINPEEIELFVSDNCSDDNTAEVVKSYIDKGLPITYNRNDENIGASRNFLKCMQRASGKYILLLGDDDVLNSGALKYILDVIRGKNYGLIHIHRYDDIIEDVVEYDDVDSFLKRVSFWFTFVSGSIFRKDIVNKMNPEKYRNTHLLQMPYFIESARVDDKNLLINSSLLRTGLDGGSNGGYNFYEVFVHNYLSIWRDFKNQDKLRKETYRYIKKDVYVKFIQGYNIKLLAHGEGIKKKKKDLEGQRGGFMIDDAWKILFHNYGNESYFYRSLLSIANCHIRYVLYKLLNKQA